MDKEAREKIGDILIRYAGFMDGLDYDGNYLIVAQAQREADIKWCEGK